MPTPPTPPTPPAPPAPPATELPARSRWVFRCGASEIEIETTGDATLDPGSDPMFDLHGDGTLRVCERSAGTLRVLVAAAGNVSWTVNGTVGAFDAKARSWLRRLLNARPSTPVPPNPPGRP